MRTGLHVDGALNVGTEPGVPSRVGEKWVVFPAKIGYKPYFIPEVGVLTSQHSVNFVTYQSPTITVHPVNEYA